MNISEFYQLFPGRQYMFLLKLKRSVSSGIHKRESMQEEIEVHASSIEVVEAVMDLGK